MKTFRLAALSLAALALLPGLAQVQALTVTFTNQNSAAVPNSNIWVMFGGQNNGTLAGTLTYSGTAQPIVFGTSYLLSNIANQTAQLSAATAGKICIAYGVSMTGTSTQLGNPDFQPNSSDPVSQARWDKVEYSQFTGTLPSSGWNLSAADFFSIPLEINTYLSGILVGTEGWHPLTPTATVFQSLGNLSSGSPSQAYAVITGTTPSGTLNSVPVTFGQQTLKILRIINPNNVSTAVANPYNSLAPYVAFTSTSTGGLNSVTVHGTYGGATPPSGAVLPAAAYSNQDYDFTGSISPAGDLILTGSGTANINTGSNPVVGAQTLTVQAADLPNGIYTGTPNYYLNSYQNGTVALQNSNCIYDQVLSDYLAGMNMGLVATSGTDPRTGVTAGQVLGLETTDAWYSTGPTYGADQQLTPEQLFGTLQPKGNYYNQFAGYLAPIYDAYGFPYTDKLAKPLLNTTPGAADTIEIVILPDQGQVASVETPGSRQLNKKISRFGSTKSALRVDSRARVQADDLKLQLSIDHPTIGDLTVRLISPRGKVFRIHNRTGGEGNDIAYGATPLDGNSEVVVNGTWRLEIKDRNRPVEGHLLNWALIFPEE